MADRSRFGKWGVELSDDELARAVVGVLQRKRAEPVIVSSWRTPARDAAHYRDLPREGSRFQVDPSLLDLAELLSRPGAGAASAFLTQNAEAGVVWTWPIRIGILPGHRENDARAIAALPWSDVFDLVELSATTTECDLLLLPGSFRSSLAALLDRRLTIHADVVVVIGKLDESGERALRLIEVLRDAADAAGVVVANQPRANREMWFREFIRAMTHDQPLDVAVFAQNQEGVPPPMLVASPKLIEATQLKRHVRRMAEAVETVVVPAAARPRSIESAEPIAAPAMPPMAAPASVDLSGLRELEHIPADAESHLASHVGRAVRTLPPDLRNAATRGLDRDPDQRRVVHKTTDASNRLAETLAPNERYRLQLRIGYPKRGERAANAAFPHHLLPPSMSGHRLTIVFAELPQDDGDDFRQPEVRELVLPAIDESKPVDFWFRTSARTKRYDARVIVLHQNRVLQTLRYSAVFGKPIALDEELDAYRFDDLEGRTRFDAALVANKAGGRMGLCIVVDGKARYVAPGGLDQQVEKVSAVLDKATALVKLPKKLDDAKLLQVMLTLSHEGNQLWTALDIESAGTKLLRAPRLQVVSARPGEYLPVEFFYGRAVPRELRLCSHAVAALDGKDAKCSTANARDELCPVEFWGLSRVIEHVPWISAKKRKATKSVRTKPLLDSVLVGISERVPKKDVTALMKTLNAVTNNNAHLATSWRDWEAKVESVQPSLLVLLAHSSVFQLTGGPALEISGDVLAIASIEPEHVRAKGSKEEPVVLLLACDSVRTPIQYQNAVERLKAKHAGVVLGTLSTVLGPHAATFAGALVQSLASSTGKALKFGDVLLKVKRERIRAGDPFALTLVAYGDSEIRI